MIHNVLLCGAPGRRITCIIGRTPAISHGRPVIARPCVTPAPPGIMRRFSSVMLLPSAIQKKGRSHPAAAAYGVQKHDASASKPGKRRVCGPSMNTSSARQRVSAPSAAAQSTPAPAMAVRRNAPLSQ